MNEEPETSNLELGTKNEAPRTKHVLFYTDANTRVRDLPVRFIRRTGIGRLILVEVLQSWSRSYEEDIGVGRTQHVTKEFHPGQQIVIDECYTKP